ncbi:MAG TPA: exopolysaccharide biosynthesis polyprenyl glycosylphosphotransferase [Egibacteraceae bacterium]|nr:exopolysaccharide biosynthesis polyprenyl glycosylphosphotransferase [Egibacteraceae bacterium]
MHTKGWALPVSESATPLASIDTLRFVPRPLPDERRRTLLAYVLVDALAIGLGSAAALLGATGPGARNTPVWTVAFGALAFLALHRRGFYRLRLRPSLLDQTAELVAATASVAAAVLTVRVLSVPTGNAGGQTVRLWVFVTAYLVVGRTALSLQRRACRRSPASTALPTLIVGTEPTGRLVATRLLEHPQLGLRPIGFLDDHCHAGDGGLPLPILGTTADLEAQMHLHRVAHLIVCFSATSHSVLLDMVRRARRSGVAVSLLPRLYEEVTSRARVRHVGGIPLLEVSQPDPRGWQFTAKYAIDRVVAFVALLLLLPLLLALAAAVAATSPGPVLYRQRRVGLDAQEFDIFKFRTMYVETDQEEPGATVAEAMLSQRSPLVNGDRRTPVGRWLRRFSLDELPQLMNVLRGEMSLIGPRPERPSLADAFERRVYRYGDRHRVKSGITGWAQVAGLRGSSSLEDRVEWDNYYIENWSWWLDVKIAILTVPALLRGENAE